METSSFSLNHLVLISTLLAGILYGKTNGVSEGMVVNSNQMDIPQRSDVILSIAMTVLAIILASLFMLGAIGFTIVPILPGTLLVFPGIVAYGLIKSFSPFDKWFWIGEIVLTVIIFVADNVAQVFGIKKMGGSKAGLWGGTIGMFVIPLIISPLGPIAVIFGPLIGAVAGAMIGELFARRTSTEILKVGFGATLSFLGGTFFKVILVLVQVVWFYKKIFF
jgi:uncharacterized protein YqgC (DUF456 family)